MNTGMTERQVRELAYNIWESEGRPVGQAERHWNMAQSLVESDGERYLMGENLSGDNFLGDQINSEDQAAILADDREYNQIVQNSTQASQNLTGQSGKTNGQSGKSSEGQSVQGTAKGDSNKKKPGKKSSNNILV